MQDRFYDLVYKAAQRYLNFTIQFGYADNNKVNVTMIDKYYSPITGDRTLAYIEAESTEALLRKAVIRLSYLLDVNPNTKFIWKGQGRIYTDNIEEVKDILQKLDSYEYDYCPANLVTDFNYYPQTVYSGKFELDIDAFYKECKEKDILAITYVEDRINFDTPSG